MTVFMPKTLGQLSTTGIDRTAAKAIVIRISEQHALSADIVNNFQPKIENDDGTTSTIMKATAKPPARKVKVSTGCPSDGPVQPHFPPKEEQREGQIAEGRIT